MPPSPDQAATMTGQQMYDMGYADATQRLQATHEAVRRHLLCMLVRDFGYWHEFRPLYGHAPLRHQHAWKLATGHQADEWPVPVDVVAAIESVRDTEHEPVPYANRLTIAESALTEAQARHVEDVRAAYRAGRDEAQAEIGRLKDALVKIAQHDGERWDAAYEWPTERQQSPQEMARAALGATNV